MGNAATVIAFLIFPGSTLAAMYHTTPPTFWWVRPHKEQIERAVCPSITNFQAYRHPHFCVPSQTYKIKNLLSDILL